MQGQLAISYACNCNLYAYHIFVLHSEWGLGESRNSHGHTIVMTKLIVATRNGDRPQGGGGTRILHITWEGGQQDILKKGLTPKHSYVRGVAGGRKMWLPTARRHVIVVDGGMNNKILACHLHPSIG